MASLPCGGRGRGASRSGSLCPAGAAGRAGGGAPLPGRNPQGHVWHGMLCRGQHLAGCLGLWGFFGLRVTEPAAAAAAVVPIAAVLAAGAPALAARGPPPPPAPVLLLLWGKGSLEVSVTRGSWTRARGQAGQPYGQRPRAGLDTVHGEHGTPLLRDDSSCWRGQVSVPWPPGRRRARAGHQPPLLSQPCIPPPGPR